MAPHYERPQAPTETTPALSNIGSGRDDDAIEEAAEALRQAEIEAVKPGDAAPHSGVSESNEPVQSGAAGSPTTTEVASISRSELVNMSIDELRGVAAVLDVPDRETMIEQDELIEAIRRRLPR